MRKASLLASSVMVLALVFATTAHTRVADTLTLKTNFVTTVNLIVHPCVPTPAAVFCGPVPSVGPAIVPGLGSVTTAYFFTEFPIPGVKTCDSIQNEPPFTLSTDVLTVAGKGEIDLALSDADAHDSQGCVIPGPGGTLALSYTVIGGTGPYAGASGSGTVSQTFGTGLSGTFYTGTLTAPGVTFDLTPPRISGASSKTVAARKGQKRVRLAVKVTARDAVDGAVAAICKPKPGSLVPIGRTRVSCSATDSSANTAHAQFTYSVKKPR